MLRYTICFLFTRGKFGGFCKHFVICYGNAGGIWQLEKMRVIIVHISKIAEMKVCI